MSVKKRFTEIKAAQSKVSVGEPKGFGIVPKIGAGNIVELLAITRALTVADIRFNSDIYNNFLLKCAALKHQKMSESTKASAEYSKNSSSMRGSLLALPFLFTLDRAISRGDSLIPNAEFFLSPQNMTAEQAVRFYERSGENTPVIIPMPDAWGKYTDDQIITEAQKKLHHLTWNERAYGFLEGLGLQVKLISLIDPLLAFKLMTEELLKEQGYTELLEQENVLIVKLSGSGGDATVINQVISSLQKNLGDKALFPIVFAGTTRTAKKIHPNTGRKEVKIPSISANGYDHEARFYNLAARMQAGQMLLTYPSEQVKHLMVLAKNGIRPNVVFLHPRGKHEVKNLIEYIQIAKTQNIRSTVCSPKELQQDLQNKLAADGLAPHVVMVDPNEIEVEHFSQSPDWKPNQRMKRITIGEAVKEIIKK